MPRYTLKKDEIFDSESEAEPEIGYVTDTEPELGSDNELSEAASDTDGEFDDGDFAHFCRNLAFLAKQASSGIDKSRRFLRAFAGSPYKYHDPLPPFTEELRGSILQLAEEAESASNGEKESLDWVEDFMMGFPVRSDELENIIEAEIDENRQETLKVLDAPLKVGFACVCCGCTVMQERDPSKPCGKTKFFMDFKKRCSFCR